MLPAIFRHELSNDKKSEFIEKKNKSQSESEYHYVYSLKVIVW